MRIDFNKIIAIFVYTNAAMFISFLVAPLVSYSISSKLFYELSNKLSNKNDLLISNMYNNNRYPYGSNTFEYSMHDLPVKNHLYGLPELNLYLACESPQNVQFVKIVESIDNKHVRTNVVNAFCNKSFDYFSARKETTKATNIIMRIMNYLSYPNPNDVPMENMDNLNYINIETDNSAYVTNTNNAYTVHIDYLGSKNIKLLTKSNMAFKFDINNEILIKKIISKHPYLIKCCCFITVYISLLVSILLTYSFWYTR